MNSLKLSILGIALVSLTALSASAYVVPPGSGHYEGAGTIVTSFSIPQGQITIVDNGAVVCKDTDNDNIPDHGSGGVCIPFGTLQGDSILVTDALYGTDVAFQVCVDANGDGICTGGGGVRLPSAEDVTSECKDLILFSHNSATGAFHNPLYVGSFFEEYWQDCGGNGFAGYVVIVCAGVHSNQFGGAAHTHQVTEGLVTGAWTGGNSGVGDFCGAPTAAKAYVIE